MVCFLFVLWPWRTGYGVRTLDARVRDSEILHVLGIKPACSDRIFCELNWQGILHPKFSILDYVSCPRHPSHGQTPHTD